MLKKNILLPIAGQDFSVPSNILSPQSSFGRNCLTDKGIVTQREGHGEYSNTLLSGATMSGAVLHMARFQQSDQTLLLTRFDATKSQVYNSGTNDWDDITLSGTSWNTVVGTNFYDSASYIDDLLVTNGLDSIQKYNGVGLMTNLGGSPPIAEYIETVGEYVVIANITDGGSNYPWRLQWCDTASIENWTTGNSGFFDLLDNDQKIIGLKKFNENLVVFKDKGIYIGRLVDTSDIFSFDLIESGQSLLNNRCIVEFRGKLYYLATDGNIYVFNGYSSNPIGNKIQDEIYSVLNTERLGMTFGRVNIYRRCIEFFICQNGYDYCNFRWALNYEDGSIFYDTFTNGIASAVTFKDTSSQLTYDDFTDDTTYNNITRTYDGDLGGTGFEFKLIGKDNGKTYKEDSSYLDDNGDAIIQEYETPDFNLGDHEKLNRWDKLILQLLGTSATLYYSTDFGLNWSVINHTSSTQDAILTNTFTSYVWWKDLKSQYIRFRLSNATSDSYFSLRQLALYGTMAEDVFL